MGMAFQIKDDILDYCGEASLGKPVGVDRGEQKITLPLLGALTKVDDDKAALIRRHVLQIQDNPEFKEEIRGFVFDNGGNEYAESRLQEYVRKATESLGALPDSKEKDYLVAIAQFTAQRDR